MKFKCGNSHRKNYFVFDKMCVCVCVVCGEQGVTGYWKDWFRDENMGLLEFCLPVEKSSEKCKVNSAFCQVLPSVLQNEMR